LWASPKALVGQVQGKGIEDYAIFASQFNYQTLPKLYAKVMTYRPRSDYCPLLVEGWQYKAAFVIQFRPESDIEAGRFEGRVEHFASYKAMRFHSLEELLDFIARMLTEVNNTEQL